MYVALRPIELGEGNRVAAGQPVPQASKWPFSTLVAFENQGWIKWNDPTKKSPVEEVQEKQWASFSRNPEHVKPVLKKATPEEMAGIFGQDPVAAATTVTKTGVPVKEYVVPKVVQQNVVTNVVQEKPATIAKETETCPHCPGRTFSPTNLKRHTTLAHGKRQ